MRWRPGGPRSPLLVLYMYLQGVCVLQFIHLHAEGEEEEVEEEVLLTAYNK